MVAGGNGRRARLRQAPVIASGLSHRRDPCVAHAPQRHPMSPRRLMSGKMVQ